MKLTVRTPYVINKLILLLSNLKNIVETVLLRFEDNKLIIQEMDMTHISMLFINIELRWFGLYEFNENEYIGINCEILSLILKCFNKDHDTMILESIENGDNLNIIFDGKNCARKSFIIPCMDIDNEIMGIPEVDHDVDMTINTAYFKKLINELALFGDDVLIKCSDTYLKFITKGDMGSIDIDVMKNDKDKHNLISLWYNRGC